MNGSLQLATTFRTRPVGLVKQVEHLHQGQTRLLASAVATPRCRRVRLRPLLPATLLRGGAEEGAIPRIELLLQKPQLLLDVADGILAPGKSQLLREFEQPLVQPGEFGFLQQSHLAQPLDVRLGLDLNHAMPLSSTE